MEMTKLKSSDIHSAGHTEATGLRVVFHAKDCPARKGLECACEGGAAYHYRNATAEEHAALVASSHPGAHLHRNIVNKHMGERQ